MASNPKLHEAPNLRQGRRYCPECGDTRTKRIGPARHQRCRAHNVGELRGKKKGRRSRVVGPKQRAEQR